ncbi:autotransporter outer membrane beta-barrel domain-containing protein [Bordetella petrii]|uniref:autotransporter outer membrane beta-barrel domain-containing protein n=1 Tax=Bordetella petrii TaxID=94624 RepID=UPI0004B39253|nr:autotransporter outer membrane beta-barrel domain-containing protein [Bordetella petrii]
MPHVHARKRHQLMRETLLTMSLSMVFGPLTARADDMVCSPDTICVELDPGALLDEEEGLAYRGDDGSHDGDRSGRNGARLELLDHGANFNLDPVAGGTALSGVPGAMYVISEGGNGHDEGDGGHGNTVRLESAGRVDLVVGDHNGLGQVDAVLFAASLGGHGDGEKHDTDDDGGNNNNNTYGGDGGQGSRVEVRTYDASSYRVAGEIRNHMYGIYAASEGGDGGDQNSSVLDDQYGGTGGQGGEVRVVNRGSFYFSGAALAGSVGEQLSIGDGVQVALLRAKSKGGDGGVGNGKAGDGGAVSVEHQAGMLMLDGTTGDNVSIYGIRATSEGAEGYGSDDNSNNGGSGGDGGRVDVGVASDIAIGVARAGGAIVQAVSEGGKGGHAPAKDHSGGSGGDAGDVTVTLAPGAAPYVLSTTADGMVGIQAQSKGGFGGDGQDDLALAGKPGGAGFGGDAGNVTVNVSQGASITTAGDHGTGIVAWSVGGGGGTGGDFYAILGGSGGKGGDGGLSGEVGVYNAGEIRTDGNWAFGIDAQSNAGGGGAGGISTGIIASVGGDGGVGGQSGTVVVSNSGAVTTTGYGSIGMSAQSIGGGGGNAGVSLGLVSVGGSPGEASGEAHGSAVYMSNAGSVITLGDAAPGLSAQSIGGGGGNASGTVGIIGVGGSGEAGGDGGAVHFDGGESGTIGQLGSIWTSGDFSYGVIAQSVGGGGGNGGDTLTIGVGGAVGVGGSGELGGDGGNVNFYGRDPASITTSGRNAHGILAQSIGGGGGAGGSAPHAGFFDFTAVIVGGDGDHGGDAGDIAFTWDNLAVNTAGDAARGVMLQSIGGGGGAGGGVTSGTVSVMAEFVTGVGGMGGNGGDGGTVAAQIGNSSINTLGPDSGDPDAYKVADASAVVAQSIGGGGGAGGNVSDHSAVIGIIFTEVGTAVAWDNLVVVGGQGGKGGDGGRVTANVWDSGLSTAGQYSNGVLAQSVGGGGGDGGSAHAFSVTAVFGLESINIQDEVAVGGQCHDGGDDSCAGGDGDVVSVSLGDWDGIGQTVVQTSGDYSNGVLAQSVGGGGGDGGSANAYSFDFETGAAFSVGALVTVGGQGGAGGNGGDVVVTADSSVQIATNGSGARGIVAQSVGGGGGTGQGTGVYLGVDGQVTGEVDGGVAVDVGVGMTGGAGGDGAEVIVDNRGLVYTDGRDSDGVLAQSIGGGGGVGGSLGADEGDILDNTFNAIKAIRDGDWLTANGTLAVKVGGTGGQGGHGGPSSLYQYGSVYTSGDYADGLVVQSIGGGGGIGGGSTSSTYENWLDVNIAVGGHGGGGGQGGAALVSLGDSVDIGTQGYGAYGVLAQSIGGGGGQGGTGTPATKGHIIIGAGVGGGGGDGGDGGNVTFVSRSSNWIQTYGDAAHAVVLQSVGGGGGTGGLTMGSGGTPFGVSLDFTLSVGGAGGDGGNGGSVDVCTGGACAVTNLFTRGDMATGLLAQSVGGGGGLGSLGDPDADPVRSIQLDLGLVLGGSGGDGGNGGAVNVQGTYSIATAGAFSHGIAAQSIGGGGGMAGVNDPIGVLDFTYEEGEPGVGVRASLGSLDDGVGGDGGVVDVSVNGAIQTAGDGSHALVAQSVGGGGGMLGSVADSDAPVTGPVPPIERVLALGADGELTGGHGGAVALQSGASIVTYGRGAVGVIAQSVGGGGGIASVSHVSDAGQVSLGGGAGTWGDGGAVSVSLAGGEIATHGMGSHGVVAQSIGGGGGIGGDLAQAISVDGASWAGSGARVSGSGGDVAVAVQNQVFTNGANAHGVVAQSIGGGGGLAGSAQGGFAGSVSAATDNADNRGGRVAVNIGGTVTASGDGSAGVFAQSAGADRQGGPVAVTVDGSVIGGTGRGAGAWIASNSTERSSLTIGSAGQLSGMSGTAVRYDGAAGIAIQNSGLLSGSVYCSTPGACGIDNAPAGKMSGAAVYQASVTNAGQLVVSPQADRFGRLTVAGNYKQAGSGVLIADVDFANMRAASMAVQGDAELDGQVALSAASLLPGRELTLLEVRGASTGALQARDTPIFDFDLRQVGSQQRVSVKGADFAAASQGLARNQRAIAGHLQEIWDQGGTVELAPLFAVLNSASGQGAGVYRDRLTDLSPGVSLAPAAQMLAGMAGFTGAMMSCPAMPDTGTDGREQDCFWGQASRRSADQDAVQGTPGYSFDSNTYQVGGQREFRPGWFIGGSAAYQNNSLRADNGRAGGSGDVGYAGVVLKHQAGPWVYSAAIGGGYGSYDLDRSLGIDGYDRQASSSPDVYSAGLRLRVSRHIGITEQFYLKPYVDLDALYARMPGYTESGGPLSLDVDSSDQFVVGLSPMLEVGGRLDLPAGATMRPYAYAGASFLSDDSWDAQARFKGAPAGSDGFRASLPGDDVIGRFGVGMQVNNRSGLDFRLQYDGEVSSHTTSHAGQLKVIYRF